MNTTQARTVRRRATLLWLVVSSGWLGLIAGVAPLARSLFTAPATSFEGVLVQCCAVVALAAGSALWLASTDVWVHVFRSPPTTPRRVGPLRTALLALCGAAVLAGGSPALAQEGPAAPLTAETLAGLPLPDRAVGGSSDTSTEPSEVVERGDAGGTTVRVEPGDSLWSIAARHLGPSATTADIASYWRAIHAHNVAAIGPDPDLIHPRLRLELPPR